MRRSGVRSPSAPPRFAFGYAWRSHPQPKAKRARHSPQGDDGPAIQIGLWKCVSRIARPYSFARTNDLFRRYRERAALRSHTAPVIGKPMREEILEPNSFSVVIHRALLEMLGAGLHAGHLEARLGAGHPAVHHGVGDIGMELDAERIAVAHRLVRKIIAFRQQRTLGRDVKPFLVPLINPRWPFRANFNSGRGRADRIVTDLEPPFRMRVDA